MRNLLVIALFLISITCSGQTDRELKSQISGIPRGVKQIILSVDASKSKTELLSELVSYFMSQGYEVESIDKDLGLFQTKAKNIKFAWGARFSVIVATGKIQIRGKVILELADNAARDISNTGSLGDAFVYSFREMVRLSNGVPHDSVEYTL